MKSKLTIILLFCIILFQRIHCMGSDSTQKSSETTSALNIIKAHSDQNLLDCVMPVKDLQAIIMGYLTFESIYNQTVPGNLITFSPDGTYFVTSDCDGVLNVYDSKTINFLYKFDGLVGKSRGVSNRLDACLLLCSPDGKQIALGAYDQDKSCILVWDSKTCKLIKALKVPDICTLAYSADSKYIASGTADGEIKIWDTKTFAAPIIYMAHEDCILSLVFSPDGKYLVSGLLNLGNGCLFKIWDATTAKLIKSVGSGSCESISYSPDGKQIICGSNNGDISIWDAIQFNLIKRVKVTDNSYSEVHHASYSPDGNYLVTDEYNAVRLWDAKKVLLLQTFAGSSGHKNSTCFSHDGQRIAFCTQDGIRIINHQSLALMNDIQITIKKKNKKKKKK